MKHRHSIKGCNGHYFCVGSKIPAIDDKNMLNAIIVPKDCEDIAKLIKLDTMIGGDMSMHTMKKELGPSGYFFKE